MYALWFHDETFIAIWFCLQVVADFFFTLGAFFCKLGTESKYHFFQRFDFERRIDKALYWDRYFGDSMGSQLVLWHEVLWKYQSPLLIKSLFLAKQNHLEQWIQAIEKNRFWFPIK